MNKQLLEKYRKASEKQDLDENQKLLLEKIIALDGITLDDENDQIQSRLYDLFFDWTSREHKYDPIYQKKIKEKKKPSGDSELDKINQLKLDQEVLDFQE